MVNFISLPPAPLPLLLLPSESHIRMSMFSIADEKNSTVHCYRFDFRKHHITPSWSFEGDKYMLT